MKTINIKTNYFSGIAFINSKNNVVTTDPYLERVIDMPLPEMLNYLRNISNMSKIGE